MPPPRPQSPKAALEQARRQIAAADFRAAAQTALSALATRKRDPDLLAVLGVALTRAGRAAEALPHLLESLKRRPVHPATLLDLANCHRHRGDLDSAFEAIDKALMYKPDYAPALQGKAMLLMTLGRHDEAWDLIRPHATKASPEPALVIAYAALCRARDLPQDAERAITSLLAHADLKPTPRRQAMFELGHALDALGRYDEAFEAFTRGNELSPTRPEIDPDTVRATWTPEVIRNTPLSPEPSDLPVLVVGMPRSGTSLFEQVVCAHPAAEGVGESPLLGQLLAKYPVRSLTPQRLRFAGGAYLLALGAAMTPDTKRVLDKMPGNDIAIGLASRAIPGVRVVWRRRDPRDVCLSCYFQDFGANLTVTRDLAACARRLGASERIMRHWQEHLDTPILEDRYEDFVADPEASIRRALDFLGLPFDPACLNFHESKRRMDTASMSQVRRPVFDASVARWRHYERHLEPLLRELRHAGIDCPD
ncbi:MAG: tetratricopeptide repeat-containing sulfotransferase family protein [Phycisphaerales bacterium JB059]